MNFDNLIDFWYQNVHKSDIYEAKRLLISYTSTKSNKLWQQNLKVKAKFESTIQKIYVVHIDCEKI